MKLKAFIFATALMLPTSLFSQSYSFTSRSEAYNNLTNAVSLNKGEVWDMPDYIIPIGFNFHYFNYIMDTLYFFDSAPSILSSSDLEGGFHNIVIPFGASIVDRGYPGPVSQSPLSYQLTGEAGNRILKIEWKNVGFILEFYINNTLNDYTNFQLWLFEKDGKIEMHYGPSSITVPGIDFADESGPSVSLIPVYDYDMDTISSSSLSLVENPTNPSMVMSSEYQYLTGSIPDGMVYQFLNLLINTKDIEVKPSFSIYPNPSNDKITINGDFKENSKFTITDITGSRLMQGMLEKNQQLSIGNLLPGIYSVTIISVNYTSSSLFVKL